ncbi:MAG: DUF2235 domain-containing protein [Vicinamibacterales bacterium]
MAKHIVLCSDGTGNIDIKGRGTNVFKLFEAIDLNEHRTNLDLDAQLAFYDDGVGSKGNVLVRVAGGAVGYGLKRNVKELYRELSRVYDPGDRVFLFGFSRGAFTVRTLAGMIETCGVLQGENFTTSSALRDATEDAYDAYRAKYHSTLTRAIGYVLGWPDGAAAVDAFKSQHEPHEHVPIEFMGVWDTVDAVGMPFKLASFVNSQIYQFKFSTQTLGKSVTRACHALSIDDPRLSFEPVLWQGPDDRIKQVWFAGVHSNVGGGYPKQGMSLVALDWMLGHAEQCGLRLQRSDRELFRGHATADDLIYDPRAGLGLFYRWGPRDVRSYCTRSRIEPSIHLSVAERIAHATDDYAPGNIPPHSQVAWTPADLHDAERVRHDAILAMRAGAVEKALTAALEKRYLLNEVQGSIWVGTASYLAFLLAWALTIFSVVSGGAGLVFWFDWPLVAAVTLLIGAVAFFAAWVLGRHADRRLEDHFSSFWQKHQKDLRHALKTAKAEARSVYGVSPAAPSPDRAATG